MNPRVFREYDIRGNAERDLDTAFVTDLGRALGTHFGRAGARRIALGRDCRLHSPRLHAALLHGLRETGLAVIDVGVVATPLLYFAVFHLDVDGGVQITGSHNPPEDNGFKIVKGKSTIHGGEIQELKRLLERRDFLHAATPGPLTEERIERAYIDHARRSLRLGPRRFPVVVDAGNGAGGVIGAPLLRELGFEVTELFCDMDGRFPNHHPDPTVEENMAALREAVARRGAEVGIAFDGDADRIGVVDARGRIVWGDQLMLLFARAILAEHPGATFVSEVKCSQVLYDEIARAGGRALMWKVGHSLIKSKMKEEGALLAGEMSGHIFFAHRYLGFDDAIYAAARLCELLSQSGETLAERIDALPRVYNTPEIRLDCPDDLKFELVRRAGVHFGRTRPVIDIDGARIQFDDGWALVRASNTQPVLVLRFEARSPERLAAIRQQVEQELEYIRKEMMAP
ncbi:MAG TPA: phosphomannomutase/phosphoglucomutase [Polyangia bacterium]|jgi:phosphomannomutase/phosphoglucomutase|nr:phosphomannomutase/phosphoglucomutase [Polyangia bacterium]